MIRFAHIPHSIRLILTNKCNLTCDFCFMDAGKDGDSGCELETEEWLAFFDRLKQLMIFNVSLSGGEIFLRDDLFVLLKKLRDNRMHKLSLLTNGTLITPEYALQLMELKIKTVFISLDGLEETHNRIRGAGAFQKTIQGIKHLLSAGIKPNVTFTPIKSNYQDLGPLIDFVATMGIQTLNVNTLSPEGRCLNIYKDVVLEFPGQVEEIIDTIEEKRNLYPDVQIQSSIGFYYYLPQSYGYFQQYPEKLQMKHLKDGCGAASMSCAVTATGDVVPCEGFSSFVGGNIREQDLADIWKESEPFATIRNLGKVPMNQTPYCKNCKYIHLCDGGCRASAYLIYKDLQAPGINCPFYP